MNGLHMDVRSADVSGCLLCGWMIVAICRCRTFDLGYFHISSGLVPSSMACRDAPLVQLLPREIFLPLRVSAAGYEAAL